MTIVSNIKGIYRECREIAGLVEKWLIRKYPQMSVQTLRIIWRGTLAMLLTALAVGLCLISGYLIFFVGGAWILCALVGGRYSDMSATKFGIPFDLEYQVDESPFDLDYRIDTAWQFDDEND